MRNRRTLFGVVLCLVPGLAAAQIDLELTASPDPVHPNESLEVVLLASNTSAVPQADLTAELTLPAGLTVLAENLISDAGGCAGTACEAGEVVSWTLGTLAPGQAVRLSLPPHVATVTADGTLLSFEARVLKSAVLVVQDTATALVSAAPALDLSLAASASPVAPGDTYEYVLGFGNRSAGALSGVTLRLPAPAGATFVSASDSGALVGSAVEWSIANLPAGTGSTRRARFQVAAGSGDGTLLRASGAEIFPAGSPAQAARASLATHVATAAPLAFAITANPDPVKLGEMMEVELTASNRGVTVLPGVVLQLRVPGDVFAPAIANSSGVACPVGSTSVCDVDELATWSLGDLAPGQGTTVVLPVRRTTSATLNGSLIEYRARAAATSGALGEASASALIAGTPRFDLALWVDRDPVVPGQTLTYSLAYSNQSASAIAGAVLELPLPTGAALLSSSPGGVLTGSVLGWTLPSVAAGSGDILRARIQVPAGTPPGSILSAGSARVSDPALPTDDARASAAARVVATPGLLARVVVGPDPLRNLQDPHVEVVVANASGSAIQNTSVELRISEEAGNTTEAIYIEDGGTCPAATASCLVQEFVRWNLGTLQPGEARSVALVEGMTTSLPGDIVTFNADVRATGQHASASSAALIDTTPAFDLAIDSENDPVLPGQPTELVFRFGNDGTAVRSARLEVPLPEGTSLVSASNGGKLTGGIVSWDLGSIAVQEGGSRRLGLQLGPGTGLLDVAQARVFDPTAPLEAARAALVAQIESAPALSVSSAVSPSAVARSGPFSVSFTGRNQGALPLAGVVGQFRLSDQINGLLENLLTPAGGDCLGSTSCGPQYIASWSLGALASGGTATVGAPLSASSNAALGSYLRLRGRFTDPVSGDAIARRSVLVGSLFDIDGDGISNLDDDCPYFATADQTDTDQDGRGNACECTDQNGDGRNTVSDIVAINQAIFNPAQATALCDGNNDGLCNVNDIIAANVEIFSPTSTSTCSRQPVPGP